MERQNVWFLLFPFSKIVHLGKKANNFTHFWIFVRSNKWYQIICVQTSNWNVPIFHKYSLTNFGPTFFSFFRSFYAPQLLYYIWYLFPCSSRIYLKFDNFVRSIWTFGFRYNSGKAIEWHQGFPEIISGQKISKFFSEFLKFLKVFMFYFSDRLVPIGEFLIILLVIRSVMYIFEFGTIEFCFFSLLLELSTSNNWMKPKVTDIMAICIYCKDKTVQLSKFRFIISFTLSPFILFILVHTACIILINASFVCC